MKPRNATWFGEYCCMKRWEIMELFACQRGHWRTTSEMTFYPWQYQNSLSLQLIQNFILVTTVNSMKSFSSQGLISCFPIFPIQIASPCLDWQSQATAWQENPHCWSASLSGLGTLNNRKILILLPKGIFLILSKIKRYSDNDVIYIWTQCRLSSFCLKT